MLNFRLVYDKDTGKPKGFGFAEYPDADSAASAVRNLNDYEVMGRKLRVDFSNEGGSSSGGGGGDDKNGGHHGQSGGSGGGGYGSYSSGTNGYSSNSGGGGQATAAAAVAPPPGNGSGGSLPALPAGAELPAGVRVEDSISRTLSVLPPAQLLDVLVQMRAMAVAEPQRAAELLNQAPQLSYAIFQAFLKFGLVQPETLASVLESGGVPVSGPPPPVAAAPPVMGGGFPPPPPHVAGATGTPPMYGNIPPPVHGSYGVAPPPPPPVAAPSSQDTDALMQAVMELPQATIDALPDAERQQILKLRADYSAGRR